jgi:hypothetical protein
MSAGRFVVFAGVLAIGACYSGGRGSDGGVDGGGPDGGVAGAGGGGEDGFGAPCERATDCAGRLFCDRELDQSYAARNLPRGVDEVPSAVFPDGVCAPIPAGPYDPSGVDSCDPLAPPTHQGCGDDGTCIALGISRQTWVACRPNCEPSADASGCGRRFYTCDFDLRACVEGCQSDEECRLLLVDADGDGRADALAYDDASAAECDVRTYRCTHPGSNVGRTGDPCERLDDCERDGACVQPAQTFADHRFPGGMCTKVGCDVDGRECTGDGAVCARLRSWSPGLLTAPSCLQGCTVGAEPEADRVGTRGHGEGCRDGYRCHYNGGSGAASGVCVGGNYNGVTEDNLGAACETEADCYSPFGLGGCLQLRVGDIRAPRGTCSILDCNVPGLPDEVCGERGDCIGLSGDLTFCAQRCSSAEECADGYACTDDDADPRTSRICYPACLEDEDCRKDAEICQISPASGVGACVASSR